MKRAPVKITIEINEDHLVSYTDQHLATLWHVAQANPAPIEDPDAGQLAERIGREIIRRWLRATDPPLWHHQGRNHYWGELIKLAKWEGQGPENRPGRWVPKTGGEAAPETAPGADASPAAPVEEDAEGKAGGQP